MNELIAKVKEAFHRDQGERLEAALAEIDRRISLLEELTKRPATPPQPSASAVKPASTSPLKPADIGGKKP